MISRCVVQWKLGICKDPQSTHVTSTSTLDNLRMGHGPDTEVRRADRGESWDTPAVTPVGGNRPRLVSTPPITEPTGQTEPSRQNEWRSHDPVVVSLVESPRDLSHWSWVGRYDGPQEATQVRRGGSTPGARK